MGAFHQLLAEDGNKAILTKRRTSALMNFVKGCGLVVATILGLPLGLVGGYYLAYRSLFGSRATQGHLFLKEIDAAANAELHATGPKSCCC